MKVKRTCCTSIRRKLEDMSEPERGVCFKMVDMNCLLSSIRMPWFMSDCRVFSLQCVCAYVDSLGQRASGGGARWSFRCNSRHEEGVGVHCADTELG